MTDDYDKQCRERCKTDAERRHRDYKDECRMLQDRLRCPNCRTLWCRCTIEQTNAAWRRIKARQQAKYAARIRRCDEDLARRQAAWEKRVEVAG